MYGTVKAPATSSTDVDAEMKLRYLVAETCELAVEEIQVGTAVKIPPKEQKLCYDVMLRQAATEYFKTSNFLTGGRVIINKKESKKLRKEVKKAKKRATLLSEGSSVSDSSAVQRDTSCEVSLTAADSTNSP